MYAEYTAYLRYGGTMSEEQYLVYGARAASQIDRLTLGRAARYAAVLSAELQYANAAMADLLRNADEARQRGTLGVTAANTDGYSESYGTAADGRKALQSAMLEVMQDCLGADPYGLLYRGL